MANIQSKSERAKASRAYLRMRSGYRASLVEKPIGFDDDDFVDTGKTILHGPRLRDSKKLTVEIPRWTDTPPEDHSDVVELLLDSGDGKGFVVVASHTFTRPVGEDDFLEVFPYPIDISINDLPEYATCQLKYEITYYNDSEDESPVESFLCDRVIPYEGSPPEALTLVNPLLDDTSLPAGGKLALTVPSSLEYEWKDGDQIAIYLFDVTKIPDDLTGITPLHYGPLTDPANTPPVIDIDAQKIRDFVDAEALFLYVIRDQALNDSVPSLWTKVSLTWGALPTPVAPPTVPQADPGPLLVEHARDGVSVWFPRHAAFKPGDTAELTWGTTVVVKDFPIPDNGNAQVEIPVTPAQLILLEYGETTTGNKPTDVSYRLFRKGRPFGPAKTTINVNFEVAIPWLPWPPVVDWPTPVHPSLLIGEVKNHDATRTNQLTRADKDQDATFTFTWYDKAVNGHVVSFWWNGQEVVEAELAFDDTAAPGPAHKPGDPVTVTIPWKYIKDGKNGPKIPVQYSITATGLDNDLYSDITEVDVNAITIELPRADFPSVTGNFPNCNSLEANGDLRVKIPDLSTLLKDGDDIRVVFTPMKGESGADDPITPAIFTATYTLGTDKPITGFEFLVTPYNTCIKPLYDETGATNRRGRMRIQYFFNDGTEDIGSEPYTRITAFHDGAGECPIPRP
ncbi:hypothetical protein ACYZTL_04070 [Pseudomonas sp. LB3P81]